MGDANNAYFHAIVRGKDEQTELYKLEDQHGKVLVDSEDIEKEITTFYQALVGEATVEIRHVDVEVLRSGKKLNREQ